MNPVQSAPDLQVTPLAASHDRAAFASGVASLDTYLRTQAGQDVRRRASAVFILAARDAPARVLGYYTLSAMSLAPGDIPETARRRLPHYPQVSCTLIGRLAVDRTAQGQGLGGLLLADALHRSFEAAAVIGSCMIVVEALNETAAGFYAAHGFLRLPDSARLVLPVERAGRS